MQQIIIIIAPLAQKSRNALKTSSKVLNFVISQENGINESRVAGKYHRKNKDMNGKKMTYCISEIKSCLTVWHAQSNLSLIYNGKKYLKISLVYFDRAKFCVKSYSIVGIIA